MRSRWSAWIVTVALLAAACNQVGTTSTTNGNSNESGTQAGDVQEFVAEPIVFTPTTAWEHVLARIENGEVDLQTAIDAFSIAYGPITGNTVPEMEPGFYGSGTGPLRWLIGHWEELTETQRSEVEQILDRLTGPPPQAFGEMSGLTAVNFAIAPQGLVDDMVTNIEALTGHSLEATVVAKVAASAAAVEGNLAVTLGRNAAGGFTGEVATCEISFNPSSLNLGAAELTALAGHETLHCFDWDTGTIEQSTKRPPWVVEGIAEWAGEVLAGGSSLGATSWRDWLRANAGAALFGRTYDAIGFYAHLADSGVDVWSRVIPTMVAGQTSSEAAYQTMTEPASLETIDSWSPGYYRDPADALWDQDGPGITADHATIDQTPLFNESTFAIVAAPYAALFGDVEVTAEVVTFDSPGAGLAQLTDGSTHRLADLHGKVYCTIGQCSCPDGTNNAGTVFQQMPPGVMRIAPTGDTTGSEVTLLGWSLDRYCDDDRCHVGTWESVAWHVKRVIIGGWDVSMVIDSENRGFIDFNPAAPLLGVALGGHIDSFELVPVKIELGGKSRFDVEAKGPVVNIVAATGRMSMTAYVDLGDGWMPTGGTGSVPYGLANVAPTAMILCAGDSLLINGAIEFRRLSDEGELPAEAMDMTPTTAAGGGGDGDTPVTVGTLPTIDPCKLLSLEEVQSLFPEAEQPAIDDLGTTGLSQCSFGLALAVQVNPPMPPGLFGQGGEAFGITLVEIPGVGNWAAAQIGAAQPEFGIEESIWSVAAGNENGTVVLVPLVTVKPGSAEYTALVELLKLALSRL
ncbi:MAG TPA: hypothetical protein VIA81_08020 [Acidimicrobiia bacterium]|jgi:hypothetical protein